MPKRQVSASIKEMSRVKSFIDSKFISEADQRSFLASINLVRSRSTVKERFESLISFYQFLLEKDFTLLYGNRDALRLILNTYVNTWFPPRRDMSQEISILLTVANNYSAKVRKLYLSR